MRERDERERHRERERERERKRENERKRESVCMCVCVCVDTVHRRPSCVCVCVSEREREKGSHQIHCLKAAGLDLHLACLFLCGCACELVHVLFSAHISPTTGWRRLIGCLNLQVIFCKRATNYRVLLREMTYKDKASYDSRPPCRVFVCSCACEYVNIYFVYISLQLECLCGCACGLVYVFFF